MHIITEAWKLVALTAISCSAVFFLNDHVGSNDNDALKFNGSEYSE
jgi:hypothetical protein